MQRERREKGLARKCKDRSIDRATEGEEAAADPTTTTYVPTKSFPPLSLSLSLLAYACSMERSTIIFLGHEKGEGIGGEAGSFSHAGRGNISAQRSRYPPPGKKFFVRNGARRKKDRERERESRSTFLSFSLEVEGGDWPNNNRWKGKGNGGRGRKRTEGPTTLRMRRKKE